ncbi:hypothetical protein COSO111634_30410 [Corallococcus soli]
MPEKSTGSWGTHASCPRTLEALSDDRGTPSQVTSPPLGGRKPSSTEKRVVLPAPEAPTSATRAPAGTVRSTPFRASRPSAYVARTPFNSRARESGRASSPTSGGTGASASVNSRSAAARPVSTCDSVPLSDFTGW